MSKAIKCDRCGKFSAIQYYSIGGEDILGGIRWDTDNPRPGEKFDLCGKCGGELRKILKEWWRKKEEK